MKLLLVSGSYPPAQCGVGDYTAYLAHALSTCGDLEVSVLTSRRPGSAETIGRPTVFRAVPTWRAAALDVVEQVVALSPNIVHIQFPTQGYDSWRGVALMALAVRKRLRVPLVVTMHEYLPRGCIGRAFWVYVLAAAAHRLVVVRPGFYDRIPRLLRFLVAKKKIVFISNAAALPRAQMTQAEREILKRAHCEHGQLVVFFGFSFAHKGVDLLFRIADPREHCLLFIGPVSPDDPYHKELQRLAATPEWKGRASFTGFVEPSHAARLLAVADAAVFPYRTGGGVWNSSLHAALRQETFVLTTSQDRAGYDAATNVYYARPDNVDEMRAALRRYQGIRRPRAGADENEWAEIAGKHRDMFAAIIGEAAADNA